MASVADLATVPLFNALDDDQLGELATWFHLQSQMEGTRLVGEGAPGYTFFISPTGLQSSRRRARGWRRWGQATSSVRSQFSEMDAAVRPLRAPRRYRFSLCLEPSFDGSKLHILKSPRASQRQCKRGSRDESPSPPDGFIDSGGRQPGSLPASLRRPFHAAGKRSWIAL